MLRIDDMQRHKPLILAFYSDVISENCGGIVRNECFAVIIKCVRLANAFLMGRQRLKKHLLRQVLFSMISVPYGTGDIPVGMISASQMIYASQMKERILYHTCEASISYGASRISYCVSNIS